MAHCKGPLPINLFLAEFLLLNVAESKAEAANLNIL
jgi:hypothetical protein